MSSIRHEGRSSAMAQLGLLKNARVLDSLPPGCQRSHSSSSMNFRTWRAPSEWDSRPHAHRPGVLQRHTFAREFGYGQGAAYPTSGIDMWRTTRRYTVVEQYTPFPLCSTHAIHALVQTATMRDISGACCSGQKCIADRSHGRRSRSKAKAPLRSS